MIKTLLQIKYSDKGEQQQWQHLQRRYLAVAQTAGAYSLQQPQLQELLFTLPLLAPHPLMKFGFMLTTLQQAR
jgi:hypothetical protein